MYDRFRCQNFINKLKHYLQNRKKYCIATYRELVRTYNFCTVDYSKSGSQSEPRIDYDFWYVSH
jgi:hypothetical protein